MLLKVMKFGLTALLSFSISVGGTAVLAEGFKLTPEVAYSVALVTVFFFNFIMCRYFVFEGIGGNIRFQMAMFAASSFFFRGMEYLAFLLLYKTLHFPYIALIIGVQGISGLAKFSLYGVLFSARARRSAGQPEKSTEMSS